MDYLHTFTGPDIDLLFGVKILDVFFADDGFGEFISFGNNQCLAFYASTSDILQETAEELRQTPPSQPVII